jgi:hypothetical protein
MAANTDHFRKGFYGPATALSASIGSPDTTIPLNSTAGYPTDTAIDLTVDRVDASGNKTPTKQETITVVISGSNGNTALRGVEGTAQPHTAGAVVEITYTGATHNSIVSGILVSFNQDGTPKANLPLTSPTLISPVTQGTIDGWIGASESWAYASASTITVPTDATTKYDVGDYIKFTQTTVKYFVVTAVSSTILTLSGISGVTIANATISANYYSKTRNPHGNGTGGVPFVPIKFSAYRNAAQNTGSGGFSIINFDTKLYDTSNNFDIATNVGRFTAPYPLTARFETGFNATSTAANQDLFIAYYRNGSEIRRGPKVRCPTTATSFGTSFTTELQLSGNDYIEVYGLGSAALAYDLGPIVGAYFMGSAVSAV